MSRGIWTRETVGLMLVASYLPVAALWLWYGGADAVQRLGFALLVVMVWQLGFLLVRAQPVSISAAITSLAIAMLSPENIGAFPLLLGISFGVVMGELVFGGWGRNVVNPATVALSFLGFGFPAFVWPTFVAPVAWASASAALIGMATGTMPAGVIFSGLFVLVGALVAGVIGTDTFYVATIILVLLVADPVTSATTTLGRLLNGAVFGALILFFAHQWSSASPTQYGISAALLASLAAPSLDEFAIWLWLARRRRSHGGN